ncbi:hypothetical protein PLICRDRAFT_122715 [Plicaturopsis crispa FD-325 SS-3]|nr:hypothetical protein PLICRDRAFT_122715 [Plicaturopsis crispa FD-325 SS-3]
MPMPVDLTAAPRPTSRASHIPNAMEKDSLPTSLVRAPDGQLSAWDIRDSITYFPTELLLMIFKNVFIQSRVNVPLETRILFRSDYKGVYPPDTDQAEREKLYIRRTAWKKVDDLGAHNFFPYSLSDVCPRWHAILGAWGVPELWTRLVINIGHDATPILHVRSYLVWSKDLPLDVTILRREGYEGDDHCEGARVATVMRLLLPHLRRIVTLNVNVIDSASLPAMGTQLHGVADRLEKIAFSSRMDSGKNRPRITADAALVAPGLTHLTLDGDNFRVMAASNYQWTENFPQMQKRGHLTIADYARRDDGLTLSEMAMELRYNCHAPYLTLRNVTFAPLSVASLREPRIELILSSCHLIDLTAGTLVDFFRVITLSIESLDVVTCSLPGVLPGNHVLYDSYFMTLERTEGDILELLAGGRTHSLTVKDCPSFDDGLLEEMTEDSILENLVSLSVTRCPNVSSGALRKLVEARQAAAALSAQKYPDFKNHELEVSALDEVVFDGNIADEDQQFFKGNHRFSGSKCYTFEVPNSDL